MSRIWMAVDPLGIGATQHGENLCDCVERIRHCAYVKFCGFCPPKVPEPQDNLFPFFRWNVEYQKISYELHIVGNVLERSILSYKEVYIIEENQFINQFFLCPFSGYFLFQDSLHAMLELDSVVRCKNCQVLINEEEETAIEVVSIRGGLDL